MLKTNQTSKFNEQCPVCGSEAKKDQKFINNISYDDVNCTRCGFFMINEGLEELLYKYFTKFRDRAEIKRKKLSLSHFIAKMINKSKSKQFEFTYEMFDKIKDNLSLPNHAELADNLILYLGNNSEAASQEHKLTKQDILRISAIVGCVNNDDLIFVFEHLKEIGLIAYRSLGGVGVSNGYSTMVTERSYNIKLTFVGWQKYEELKNGKPESKPFSVESMLASYPTALEVYKSALDKYEKHIYQRNVLDDLRLCLELLLKEILQSKKTLENQKEALGKFMKDKGSSPALRGSFQTLINHFAQYQNDHVKHNDAVNPDEIELVKDQVDSFIKHLIKLSEKV